jgi:hypothetical protein
VRTIRREHDRLGELVMLLVDAHDDPRELNTANLRRLTGRTLRESLLARERALAVLTGNDSVLDALQDKGGD